MKYVKSDSLLVDITYCICFSSNLRIRRCIWMNTTLGPFEQLLNINYYSVIRHSRPVASEEVFSVVSSDQGNDVARRRLYMRPESFNIYELSNRHAILFTMLASCILFYSKCFTGWNLCKIVDTIWNSRLNIYVEVCTDRHINRKGIKSFLVLVFIIICHKFGLERGHARSISIVCLFSCNIYISVVIWGVWKT